MTPLLEQVAHSGLPVASLLWLLPAVASVAVTRLSDGAARQRVLTTVSLLDFFLAGVMALGFDREVGGQQMTDLLELGPLRYHVAVDGLNLLFLPLATLLGFLMSVYGREIGRRAGLGWHSAVLGFQACTLGMLLSDDMLTYAVFAAAEIFPMRSLIIDFGTGPERARAARDAARALGASVALWLAATVILGELHREAFGAWATDLDALLKLDVPLAMQGPLFFMLFFALAIRTAMFPMHAWFPAAVTEGPVAGLNVPLLGVKVGVAGMVRFLIPLLPDAARAWSDVPTVVGLLGVLYGTILAVVQTDLRRMLAYVAVSHTGFVVVGIFTGDVDGVAGALLESLNLGVAAAGMYFAAGFLWIRTQSTDLETVRHVASAMPRFGAVFLLTALAGVGMPGTLGFDAIHLELEGSIGSHHYWTALGEAGATVLFAGTLLSWYYRLFLHQEGDRAEVEDLRPRELGIAAALAALVLAGGLQPTPWVEAVEGAVSASVAPHGEDDGAPVHAPAEVRP